MGDIALPNINYETEWQSQKLNKTYQQELEQLKREVYHEGLQVEEEGLTDIIRRKTKLPDPEESSIANSKNDATIDASVDSNVHYAKQAPDYTSIDNNEALIVKLNPNTVADPIVTTQANPTNGVDEKPEKNISEVFRDIDEKKIQSNAKDIEDESKNILKTRQNTVTVTTTTTRKVPVTTSTDATASTSTTTTEQLNETTGEDGNGGEIARRHRRHQKHRWAMMIATSGDNTIK